MVTSIKFTYEDYRNTPEDKRYELLDGELVVMPIALRDRHQRLCLEITGRPLCFGDFVGDKRSGRGVFHAPFDVVLSDTDVVQPDI